MGEFKSVSPSVFGCDMVGPKSKRKYGGVRKTSRGVKSGRCDVKSGRRWLGEWWEGVVEAQHLPPSITLHIEYNFQSVLIRSVLVFGARWTPGILYTHIHTNKHTYTARTQEEL